MRDAWLELVGCVLRPARPALARCQLERERHRERQHVVDERRAQAIARCVAAIEAARADVFAANDGVVTSRMTELEREWRRLSRADRDGELMDLWTRMVPSSWLDRKRWRDSPSAAQLDAAIALASDVEGVERAEAAVAQLREALHPYGVVLPSRVRWVLLAPDFEDCAKILERPLRAVLDVLSPSGPHAPAVLERARSLEHEILEAARTRFPDRPLLTAAIAHAALVDHLWRVASPADRTNPVAPLRELWTTGYVLSNVDDFAVTLSVPAL